MRIVDGVLQVRILAEPRIFSTARGAALGMFTLISRSYKDEQGNWQRDEETEPIRVSLTVWKPELADRLISEGLGKGDTLEIIEARFAPPRNRQFNDLEISVWEARIIKKAGEHVEATPQRKPTAEPTDGLPDDLPF